jgi:hypothetical protein
MSKNIIVDFEGWIEVDPNEVKFQYIPLIGEETKDEKVITGVEWQALSEDEQSDYILESVIDAQRDCLDGSYETIDVSLGK